MSERNGDKARFAKARKKRNRLRVSNRAARAKSGPPPPSKSEPKAK